MKALCLAAIASLALNACGGGGPYDPAGTFTEPQKTVEPEASAPVEAGAVDSGTFTPPACPPDCDSGAGAPQRLPVMPADAGVPETAAHNPMDAGGPSPPVENGNVCYTECKLPTDDAGFYSAIYSGYPCVMGAACNLGVAYCGTGTCEYQLGHTYCSSDSAESPIPCQLNAPCVVGGETGICAWRVEGPVSLTAP